MRNRFMGSILAILAALSASPATLAQTAPPSGAPKAQAATPTPDLSGMWSHAGYLGAFTKEEPPMQPWAEQTYNGIRNASRMGYAAQLAVDPSMACMSDGMPRIYLARHPFEIYQVPGRVIMIFETNLQARIIYTDGRGHLEGAPATTMGHSIGKWDGDTLVVDTTGFYGDGETTIDGSHPHSDALHIVERLRRVDRDTLELSILFDDPKAYTKPWGGKVDYQLKTGWELMEESICFEHFRDVHLPEIRRLIEEGMKMPQENTGLPARDGSRQR